MEEESLASGDMEDFAEDSVDEGPEFKEVERKAYAMHYATRPSRGWLK